MGLRVEFKLVNFYDVLYFTVYSRTDELDMIHMWICLKHAGIIPQDAISYTEKDDG